MKAALLRSSADNDKIRGLLPPFFCYTVIIRIEEVCGV